MTNRGETAYPSGVPVFTPGLF